MPNTADAIGDRIERLLRELPDGRDKQIAEELVRLVVGMYGEGLERVTGMLAEHDPDFLLKLAGDDLVGSLLLLHDLHPVDVDTRIQQALEEVRPYLGSHAGGVEYLGVDADGVAQLRLEGNCQGCPSSALTVKMAIEGAIERAAPEITGVEVAGVSEQEPQPITLLQVGMGPPAGWHSPEPSGGGTGSGWSTLPDIGPPTGSPVIVPVEGLDILVCSVRGTLYAYRDACPACDSSLGESTIDGDVLRCAGCGGHFDVRLAGKGLDDSGLHLDPLPLLSDSKGVRIAVPRAVPS